MLTIEAKRINCLQKIFVNLLKESLSFPKKKKQKIKKMKMGTLSSSLNGESIKPDEEMIPIIKNNEIIKNGN